MKKQFLIVRDADGLIYGAQLQDHPDDGPIIPQGGCPIEGAALVEYDPEFSRVGRRDSEQAYLVDGSIEWRDGAVLAVEVSIAVDTIDSAADELRQSIVSKQTNTEEYKRSESQAREFRAAGYPESDVPPCVAAWRDAKYREGWTARRAADDIIATADRWYGLLDGIRAMRLRAKEDVRHAVDATNVRVVVASYKDGLVELMEAA